MRAQLFTQYAGWFFSLKAGADIVVGGNVHGLKKTCILQNPLHLGISKDLSENH